MNSMSALVIFMSHLMIFMNTLIRGTRVLMKLTRALTIFTSRLMNFMGSLMKFTSAFPSTGMCPYFRRSAIKTRMRKNGRSETKVITAQGIQDAFRDAELCATALDEAFSCARPFDAAMGEYQSTRDQHVLPMYEFTCELATLAPPPPELQRLLAAMHGNQEAMDGFARVNAGVTSPADFFSEGSASRILAAAAKVEAG